LGSGNVMNVRGWDALVVESTNFLDVVEDDGHVFVIIYDFDVMIGVEENEVGVEVSGRSLENKM
jgi:hypothetical protein